MAERERLSPKHNPFFQHADIEMFLARRNGEIVGRIAAIDDRLHNETHHDNVAMFGFFEAADQAAARELLEAAERWAAARGPRTSGDRSTRRSTSAGLLIDGFDTDAMLLMPHNPPEYAAFIEAAGYRRSRTSSRGSMPPTADPPVAERLAARVQARHGIHVRPLEMAEFARETEWLREVYCGAWENNWGFVPPTIDEFRRLAKELKPIFDRRGAVCAEIDGKPVACAIAIPDINQALKGTSGRLFPLALIRLLFRSRIIDQGRLLPRCAARVSRIRIATAPDAPTPSPDSRHALPPGGVLVGARGQQGRQPAR